jgi:Excreted virulence factor EspC, type VII ESX diderm
MADSLRVDPSNLRDAATRHNEVADYLRAVPAGNDAIRESLDSLGPIFGDLREAAAELLEERRACYHQQADDHVQLAQGLATAADRWDAHEDERAAAMRALGDEGS